MAQQGKKENILIFGATGYIGTHITDKIVESKGSFGRIAIFTSPSTVEKKADVINKLKAEGVEIIVGDATKDDDIVKALQGINTIVSAVGRGFIDGQINWIKIAEQVPTVTRFFPSEYGTDIEYGPESANEKPHQQKLKVRAALEEAKYLDHTYVVTGPYAEAVLRSTNIPGSGSYDVKAEKAILYGDGTGKISLTTKDDVGRLTVKALLHPEASKNRALKVNSFTTTEQEALAEFEKQSGGQKWTVEYISIDDLKKLEKDAWDSGSPIATLFTLRRIWATGGTLYEKRDNYLIDGDDTETLQHAVNSEVASQAGEKSTL